MIKKSLIYTFSDDEFRNIVNESYSITEITKKLGYKTYKSGGGRDKVKEKIAELNLDTSHFKTNGRQHEKPPHNKYDSYEDYLINGIQYKNRITLKDIILRNNLIEYKCSICGNNGVWNNKPLTLQLHHINGDSSKNELENLTFLCPNCHAQTENYSYKNAKHVKKIYHCTVCGTQITKNCRTGMCKECANKIIHTKERPTKKELLDVVKRIKFKKYICFEFGVSEHTLVDWLVYYNLPTHIKDLHIYLDKYENQE